MTIRSVAILDEDNLTPETGLFLRPNRRLRNLALIWGSMFRDNGRGRAEARDVRTQSPSKAPQKGRAEMDVRKAAIVCDNQKAVLWCRLSSG
jgi:hypothetical protein